MAALAGWSAVPRERAAVSGKDPYRLLRLLPSAHSALAIGGRPIRSLLFAARAIRLNSCRLLARCEISRLTTDGTHGYCLMLPGRLSVTQAAARKSPHRSRMWCTPQYKSPAYPAPAGAFERVCDQGRRPRQPT